jgi:hypothetical protein
MTSNSCRFHSAWTRGWRWFAALGGISTPAATAAVLRLCKRVGQPGGQGLTRAWSICRSIFQHRPNTSDASSPKPNHSANLSTDGIHAQNSSTPPQNSTTAAASCRLDCRGSSGLISRKAPEMKSLVEGSISTSDEMPYHERRSSSARPIHTSSDCSDHGGAAHSVSTKIRRSMGCSRDA